MRRLLETSAVVLGNAQRLVVGCMVFFAGTPS
jgi:hypothetical protein